MRIIHLLKLCVIAFLIVSGPAHAAFKVANDEESSRIAPVAASQNDTFGKKLIVKCADAHGRFSYQDKPCSGDEVSSQIAQTAASPKDSHRKKTIIVTVPVGKDIAYMIAIPSDWIVEMSDFGDSPTMTARVTGKKPLSLLMTFSPRRMSLGLDESTVAELMKVVEYGHADTNLEKLISTQRVDLIQSKGIGQLNTYLDRKLVDQRNLPDGQFIYTITGVVVIEGRPVTVSIFTNELGSDDYTKALLAIHMLVKAHRK